MIGINIIDLVTDEKYWDLLPKINRYPILQYGDIENGLKFSIDHEDLVGLIMECGVSGEIARNLIQACASTGFVNGTYEDYVFEYPTGDMFKRCHPSKYKEVLHQKILNTSIGRCICGQSTIRQGSRIGDRCQICGTVVGYYKTDEVPGGIDVDYFGLTMPVDDDKKDVKSYEILANKIWSDNIKLAAIFDLYKDDLKDKFPHLYYAILGWRDSHTQELLSEKCRINTDHNQQDGQN